MFKYPTLLLTALLLCSKAVANDEQQLSNLKQEIKKLEQWLNTARDEHSQLDQALRKSDLEIAELLKKIERTRTELKEEQFRLKKLRLEQSQLRELKQQHRQHLAEQLRSAQKLGDQGPLKLLLNQNDPQQAQRMMRYFDYFNVARIKNIQRLLAELQHLDTIAEQILQQERKLQQSESRLLKQNRALTTRKQAQKKLLASLSKQLFSKEQRLRRKQTDRKRLEKLLGEVQNLISNSPRKNDERPFRAMKGKLPRPASGRISKAFGNRRDQHARWDGWLINTLEGQKVRAVHHGRVVFSDWLRGFGLITIIDHGHGYLSLYAHNQTLFHDVGTWVNQGDTLALSGINQDSGKANLYFEIRHQGRPQDPAVWLKRR
jgi:septal ring factor EnvC (AmiA/AmiB activator)